MHKTHLTTSFTVVVRKLPVKNSENQLMSDRIMRTTWWQTVLTQHTLASTRHSKNRSTDLTLVYYIKDHVHVLVSQPVT